MSQKDEKPAKPSDQPDASKQDLTRRDVALENSRGGPDPTGGLAACDGGGPGENIRLRSKSDLQDEQNSDAEKKEGEP